MAGNTRNESVKISIKNQGATSKAVLEHRESEESVESVCCTNIASCFVQKTKLPSHPPPNEDKKIPPPNEDKKIPPPKPPKPTKEDIDKAHKRLSGVEKQIFGSKEGFLSDSREVSVAKQMPEPTVTDSGQPLIVESSSGTGIQDDGNSRSNETKDTLIEGSSDIVKDKQKVTDNEPFFSGLFKIGLFNKKKKPTEQKNDSTEAKNEEIKERSAIIEDKSAIVEEKCEVTEEKTIITDEKNKLLDEKNKIVEEQKRLTEEKNAAEEKAKLSEKQRKLIEGKKRLMEEKNKLLEKKDKIAEMKMMINEIKNSTGEKIKLPEEKNELSEVRTKLCEEKNKLIEEKNRLTEERKKFTELQERLMEEKRNLTEKRNTTEEKSKLCEEKEKLSEKQRKLTEEKKKLLEEKSKLLEQKDKLTEMKMKITGEESKPPEEKNKLSEVRSKLCEEKNKLIEEKNRLTEQKKKFAELQEILTEEKRKLTEQMKKSAEEKNKLPQDKEKLMEEKRKLTEEKNKIMEERNKLLEEKNKLTEKKIQITEELKKSSGEKDKLPDEKNKLFEERNKLIEEKNKLTNEKSKLFSGSSLNNNSTNDVNDKKQPEPILPSTESGQTSSVSVPEKSSEEEKHHLKSVDATKIHKGPPVRPPPPSRRFERSDDNLSVKSEMIKPDRPAPPSPSVSLKKPKGPKRKSRSRSKTVEVTPESLQSTSKPTSFVQRFKTFLDFGKKKPGKIAASSEPDLSKTEETPDEFDTLFSSSSPKDHTLYGDTNKEKPLVECSSAENKIILTSQATSDNVISVDLGTAAIETPKIISNEPAKEIEPDKKSAFAKVNESTTLPLATQCSLLSAKPNDVIVQKEELDKADNSQTTRECPPGSLHCDNGNSSCTSSTNRSKLPGSLDMSSNMLSSSEVGGSERDAVISSPAESSKQVYEETVNSKSRKEVCSSVFYCDIQPQAMEKPAQTLPATTSYPMSSKNEEKKNRDGIQQELNSIFQKKMDLKSPESTVPSSEAQIRPQRHSSSGTASSNRDELQQELNSILQKKMNLKSPESNVPSSEAQIRTQDHSSSGTASANRDEIHQELNSILQKKMNLKLPESNVTSGEAQIRTQDHSSSGTASARSSDVSCQESSDESELDQHDGPTKILSPEEKKLNKLRCIAQEIMSSESTFVDVLRLLNDDFRSAVRECSEEKGSPIVPEDVMNTIFHYLPQLQNLNENLLAEIKQRTDNWGPSQKISDVIVKIGPFLKLYSSYIREFASVSVVLDEACRKHCHFGQLVKDFEARSICQKLALKHFLLKPVQRIPQYRLLLEDYLRNLTPDSVDYEDTVKALQIVSEVANHANEYMKQGDNCLKLVSIQNSLLTHHEIVKPGKVFIREGELLKLSRRVMQSRWFILFNDSLLYLTPAQQGLFRINHELPLTGMQVSVSKQTEYRNEFSVISVTRSFTLAAKSSEERDGWIRDLNRAIKENDEKRSSFITKLEKDTSSFSLPDVSLGKQAPIWIPDSRVTMCQLCMTDFTITFRRHHCRACGRVVCSNCSFNKAVLQYLDNQSARVCDVCNDKLNEGVNRNSRPISTSSSCQGTPDPEVEGAKFGTGGAGSRNSKMGGKKGTLPNVLLEEEETISSTPYTPVRANDQGSDISGHLFMLSRKAWKRYWFVLKDKVLYTYKASEDVAAIKSLPLLGYTVETTTTAQQGVDANHIFVLKHLGQTDILFHAESVGVTERWLKAVQSATVL